MTFPQRSKSLILGLAWASSFAAWSATWAAPIPPRIPSFNDEISVRLDVRNLVGPNNQGKLSDAEMESRVEAVNEIWAQCGIHFVSRVRENIDAAKYKIPYLPQSQADLSQIALVLNPNGFNHAIPLTLAGVWNFYDPSSGLYLKGLGWYFLDGAGALLRIGAMVDNQRLFKPVAGKLIAHELGHALTLPHVPEPRNLMGREGTDDLTVEQCNQARMFLRTTIADFVVGEDQFPRN